MPVEVWAILIGLAILVATVLMVRWRRTIFRWRGSEKSPGYKSASKKVAQDAGTIAGGGDD